MCGCHRPDARFLSRDFYIAFWNSTIENHSLTLHHFQACVFTMLYVILINCFVIVLSFQVASPWKYFKFFEVMDFALYFFFFLVFITYISLFRTYLLLPLLPNTHTCVCIQTRANMHTGHLVCGRLSLKTWLLTKDFGKINWQLIFASNELNILFLKVMDKWGFWMINWKISTF